MFFIAEVGSNHNGNLDRAFALIDMAARTGCQAVKFQLYTPERLYAPGHVPDGLTVLPSAWLPDLQAHAHARALEFGCSVFSVDEARVAARHCDFLKVSSYSLLDANLLHELHVLNLPVILSTGMATDGEVRDAVAALSGGAGNRIRYILHCVSKYPCAADECNLSRISYLRKYWAHPIGYSDHSALPGIVASAVLRHGAKAVELHVDLDDGAGVESRGKHCWTEGRLNLLMSTLGGIDFARADGYPHGPYPCEMGERAWRADPSDGLRPQRKARL